MPSPQGFTHQGWVSQRPALLGRNDNLMMNPQSGEEPAELRRHVDKQEGRRTGRAPVTPQGEEGMAG